MLRAGKFGKTEITRFMEALWWLTAHSLASVLLGCTGWMRRKMREELETKEAFHFLFFFNLKRK